MKANSTQPKAVLALSAFAALGIALASTSAQAATQTSATTAKKSTWKKIRENSQFLYWSMLSGPGLNSNDAFSTTTASGSQAPINVFHMTWLGYKVAENNHVGIQQRFIQDFGYGMGHQFAAINPRVYWRRANAVDNKRLNMLNEIRLEIPTTASDRAAGMIARPIFIQNWQLKTKNKDWFLGLSFFQDFRFYNSNSRDFVQVAAMPNITYTLNSKWALYTWAWLDAFDTAGDGGLIEGWKGGDADYVRVGPVYSPVSNFQIFPCVQAYLFQNTFSTMSVGLELSAQL
ncbi:MAG: hypothetical protein JNL01_02685 [Bdellovibrionales bacterium]|nr:hypothetical protein [Bdellovibrionales bacterium]